jgi:hypothetical protein
MVQVSAKGGKAVTERHGITSDKVLKIDAVLSRDVYGRKAFAVSTGTETAVVWPSQVVKVRHPKAKKRKAAP